MLFFRLKAFVGYYQIHVYSYSETKNQRLGIL